MFNEALAKLKTSNSDKDKEIIQLKSTLQQKIKGEYIDPGLSFFGGFPLFMQKNIDWSLSLSLFCRTGRKRKINVNLDYGSIGYGSPIRIEYKYDQKC